jgi:hypothetical protein
MKKIGLVIAAVFMLCAQSVWAAGPVGMCTCHSADDARTSPLTLTFHIRQDMCKTMDYQLSANPLVVNSDNCDLKGRTACQVLIKPRHYDCKFSIT